VILLQAFAGRDASQAFLSYHRKAFPHNRAKEAFHADDKSVKYDESDNADFLELCERIHKVRFWFIFKSFGIVTYQWQLLIVTKLFGVTISS